MYIPPSDVFFSAVGYIAIYSVIALAVLLLLARFVCYLFLLHACRKYSIPSKLALYYFLGKNLDGMGLDKRGLVKIKQRGSKFEFTKYDYPNVFGDFIHVWDAAHSSGLDTLTVRNGEYFININYEAVDATLSLNHSVQNKRSLIVNTNLRTRMKLYDVIANLKYWAKLEDTPIFITAPELDLVSNTRIKILSTGEIRQVHCVRH